MSGGLWQGDDITLRSRSPQGILPKQDVSLQPFADSVVCLQVSQHNAPQDCWVSILGEVFDITPLVKVHDSSCSHSVYKLHRTGYSTLHVQPAGSAGHCCSTFGSSCRHRHLTLVYAMLFEHSSSVHIPALLTLSRLSGSMPRLVTSSCLWTH